MKITTIVKLLCFHNKKSYSLDLCSNFLNIFRDLLFLNLCPCFSNFLGCPLILYRLLFFMNGSKFVPYGKIWFSTFLFFFKYFVDFGSAGTYTCRLQQGNGSLFHHMALNKILQGVMRVVKLVHLFMSEPVLVIQKFSSSIPIFNQTRHWPTQKVLDKKNQSANMSQFYTSPNTHPPTLNFS